MLLYLLIIQLTVYNRTLTRFIADDKVVYQRVRRDMWLASDNSWERHRLKHLSWRSLWIILYTLEQRIAVSCEISHADWCLFWLVHLTEHKVLHRYAPEMWSTAASMLDNNFYPSCAFSYADCRCFQLSNHCQQIHSASFVHHTVLTNRNVKSESSCEIFMILFNFFYRYCGLDSFPR